jgi:hypothetical protein
MGDRGENSLGAVIFAAGAAGLLICWVWKIMWGRRRDEHDDNQSGRGGVRDADDPRHVPSAGSNGDSGHISFAPTEDEESGGGHVAMSRTNSDHICMSLSSSSSSSSGYCISDSHDSGAATDNQLTPRDLRTLV